MYINDYGQPIYKTVDIIELLYQNPSVDLSKLIIDDENEVKKYNNAVDILYSSNNVIQFEQMVKPIKLFDGENQQVWHMPEEYRQIIVSDWLYNKAPAEHKGRVEEELKMFEDRNLTDILRYMIYLVDVMRENNIVWGVGRGSSVASYCLYLIGVNKINPMAFNLDIAEFLR